MNRSRFRLKQSRASGSTAAKVRKMIQLGWQPGDRVRDVLARQTRRNPKVTFAFVAGGGSW